MDTTEFALRITDNLQYVPTGQQIQLIAALSRFCAPTSRPDGVFILNGYAGTGKTSVTGALVKSLRGNGIRTVLLAPTGRAAKVFSSFADSNAYTIHRRIYRRPSASAGWNALPTVNTNYSTNTLFIVDEASMIGNGADGGSTLLSDLVEYVYSADGCRLILLGDTAQLPPIGTTESPAMNPATFIAMGLKVSRVVMTQTVRQKNRSGILWNATSLRRQMRREPLAPPVLKASNFSDVEATDPAELTDILGSAYAADGIENSIIVTRSNRRAVDFNLAIRSRILDREEELCRGELIMISKNNYFWTSGNKEMDFIANGEIAEVVRVNGTEQRASLRFADVTLRFPDHNVEVDAKVILDSLTSDTPALDPMKMRRLTELSLHDPDRFAPETPLPARMSALKTDPYFNALHIKYAYAVTCHKAQGGQWANVFVDMGYIPAEALTSIDLYRWLYTATTRATEKVYYLNPSVRVL